jgi:hypothetical protein
MTDTTTRVPPTRQTGYQAGPQRTGWSGWVVFAAVMTIIVGAFQIIEALTALFRDTYYLVGHNGLLLRVDYTGWGWIHLIIGALLVFTGFALLSGKMWARVAGVALASLSLLANLAFIAAYPWWTVTVIALDVFIIFAITVHGGELQLAD